MGFAFLFNGVNAYTYSVDSTITNFGPAGTAPCAGGDFSSCTGDFSIEAWVNLPALPFLPEAIVDKRGPGPVGYSFYVNSNRIGLQLADATGYENDDSSGVRFTLNQWHHVAVTVQRTSAIRYYFDGKAAGTAIPGHTGSLVNKANLTIGANGPDNPGGYFNGYIDEPSIYNRALTPTEVHSIFVAGANGKCRP